MFQHLLVPVDDSDLSITNVGQAVRLARSWVPPAKVTFFHSIELVTMVVFGGMASTFGAVVGAAILTTLPQLLTVFKEYEMVTLGAVMMLTMIFMPQGLVPTLEKTLAAARRKPE